LTDAKPYYEYITGFEDVKPMVLLNLPCRYWRWRVA
jgi:hypothetical protein